MLIDLVENLLIDRLTNFTLCLVNIGEVEHCVDKLAVGAHPLPVPDFWTVFRSRRRRDRRLDFFRWSFQLR